MTADKMKFLSAAVGVVILTATPALAMKAHKGKVSGSDAYASSQTSGVKNVVGWDGRILGTDPDPNIRFQLMRDQSLGGD
jgi:hypothetical protein